VAFDSHGAAAAAHERWAFVPDRGAATQPARDARWQKYLERVDPLGELDEAERVKRAISLRKADLARMSAKGVQAKRDRRVAELFDDGGEAA